MIKDWEVLGGYLDQFSHCRRRTEARESKDFAKAMCCQGAVHGLESWPCAPPCTSTGVGSGEGLGLLVDTGLDLTTRSS